MFRVLNAYRIILNTISCILCLAFPALSTCQRTSGSFSFTLSGKARTSAGVFKQDGTLVRTLWSLVDYSGGEHIEKWDGLLDDGTPAPKDNYQVKILSNNVQYEWEGAVIGNTSDAGTGNTKLRFFDPLFGMAVANGTIYWAAGYDEGWPANFKTSLNDPNSKTWIGPLKQTNQVSTFVCTDGNLVYWGGGDPFDTNNETFVFATRTSDDEPAKFAAGVAAKMEWGSTYESTIAYMNTPRSVPSQITGMAVQASGKYFFVTRKGLNQLQVINKTTGELIKTIITQSPSIIQSDHQNNIWLVHGSVVEKYFVGTDGALTSSGLIIPISEAGAIAISPDNKVIIIADLDKETVRAFSNETAKSLWSLGASVSYIKNSKVENDKFYWKDIRKEYPTFLSYLPDGSFYVGDQQNRRVMHYSRDRIYIDMVMYQQALYNVFVDPNDPTRLFADFMEFKIDYSKPLGRSNGSWILVRNWGANIGKEYDFSEKMRYIVTLKNGRTYARLRTGNKYTIIELVKGGSARYTNISFPRSAILSRDGSKIVGSPPIIGLSQTLSKYSLTGFDQENNPVWTDTSEELVETPPISMYDPICWEGWRAEPFTSSNQIVFFDYSKAVNGHGQQYHLGAITKGTDQWLWRTAQSTSVKYTGPFPRDGWFDSGNGVKYPGGLALVSGQDIFWSYHGENWKQSQTNIWNHVYNNGLMVGQFGTLTPDHPGEEAFAEGAGNAFTGSIVRYNGETYLYHGDETCHAAVHRWHIKGLNTIRIQNALYPLPDRLIDSGQTDLLEGLTRGINLVDGSAGWSRNPKQDYEDGPGNYFRATTGEKTYDVLKDPDLFIICALKWTNPSSTASVTRELGNDHKLSSWKMRGLVLFDYNTPNEPSNPSMGGSYLEILDINGKTIARFFIQRDAISGTNVIGNGQLIYHTRGNDLEVTKKKFQPIEVSAADGYISIHYAQYKTLKTVITADPGADWSRPKTLRLYFYTNQSADNYTRSVDFSELRFFKKE
jgi:hypothetical protein